MTATLINIGAPPPTPDLAGSAAPQAVPTEGRVDGPPQDRQSFGVTMEKLGNAGAERVSEPLPTAESAGNEPVSTVHADVPDPAPTVPSVSLPSPLADELSIDTQALAPALEQMHGRPLPENGNSLPASVIAAQVSTSEAGVETLTTPVVTAPPQTVSNQLSATSQPIVIESTQAAVASVPAQPVLPNGRLVPDAPTAVPTAAVADDSSVLPQRTSPPSESVLQQDFSNTRLLQQTIESMIARQEAAPTGRSSAVADFAAVSPESSPAGFIQSNSPAPVRFDQLMELPQFQNMRPLQPTSDPQTFMAGLGQRLMVMSDEGIQSARLKLHPENLGTLDVRIRVEDDTARVWFTAQHGAAREALESALPKLKDLFAQQGMELVEADVGSGNDERRAADAFDLSDESYRESTEIDPDFVSAIAVPASIGYVSNHGLDIYV